MLNYLLGSAFQGFTNTNFLGPRANSYEEREEDNNLKTNSFPNAIPL